jgi:hypothetical protein
MLGPLRGANYDRKGPSGTLATMIPIKNTRACKNLEKKLVLRRRCRGWRLPLSLLLLLNGHGQSEEDGAQEQGEPGNEVDKVPNFLADGRFFFLCLSY